jgi:hypothetical protein
VVMSPGSDDEDGDGKGSGHSSLPNHMNRQNGGAGRRLRFEDLQGQVRGSCLGDCDAREGSS